MNFAIEPGLLGYWVLTWNELFLRVNLELSCLDMLLSFLCLLLYMIWCTLEKAPPLMLFGFSFFLHSSMLTFAINFSFDTALLRLRL